MDTELFKPLCLAALLIGSLVLPLYASAVLGKRDQTGKVSLLPIWAGQLGGATAGVLIIADLVHPVAGLVLALVSCLMGGQVFGRKVRARKLLQETSSFR